MLKKIITYQWLVWLLAGMLLFLPAMAAQDTVSTAGVTFAPSAKDSNSSVKATKDNSYQTDIKTVVRKTTPTAHNKEKRSLWAIFIAGLLGGFAALLMPCIFPMLPLTVSFFTKGHNKGSAIRKALLYGLSIIVIYVVLGLLVTVIFGADALNNLSTNGIFNFFFFLLLVVFAASFLGAFEITLPSSWVNRMDQNADKGGLAGLFFMAATLALVSFSCTGPIIGTLLVQAATTGALLGPAIGMFGFALALSIPFALFAMFPSLMHSLPKSGGWLNSVKMVLGFLELAFSLKFLSNVDLAYHWQWFDREVFLVLWIVIFALMGIYLLGKIRFSHDSELNYVSVPRLFMAIIVLAFTVYMVPGLWGAPLRSISAFLPPQDTQDFDLYTPTLTVSNNNAAKANRAAHKYSEIFHAPLNLDAFFDYDEGMAYAKSVNKPVMIDFTGHACVNCRKMEANVWPDKEVYKHISQDYILIQLYVDDKTDVPTTEQTATAQGKNIKTIGNKWSNLQAEKFRANSQPFYVLLDDNGNLLVPPSGADYDPVSYLKFLNNGLNAFNTAAR
jgi:thiol:disulfide interchange protein